VQNAKVECRLTAENAEVWIENSHVGKEWKLNSRNIITGVPCNAWKMEVPEGVCIDVVPMGERGFVARPYGFNDAFKGALDKESTLYQGVPAAEWLKARGMKPEEIRGNQDLQAAAIFPVCESVEDLGTVLRWMTAEPELEEGKNIWLKAEKMSAERAIMASRVPNCEAIELRDPSRYLDKATERLWGIT
jgi:hypothetical protein